MAIGVQARQHILIGGERIEEAVVHQELLADRLIARVAATPPGEELVLWDRIALVVGAPHLARDLFIARERLLGKPRMDKIVHALKQRPGTPIAGMFGSIDAPDRHLVVEIGTRSEEHTSELQ